MLLASVSDLRSELGFDDMVDITTALTTALNTAEAILQVTLGTPFTKQTAVVDTFFVQKPYVRGTLVKTEIRLRYGFVSATPVVAVVSSQPLYTEGYAEDYLLRITDGSPPTPAFTFDLERGVGKDLATPYSNSQMTVTYDCGFDADGTNAQSYDLTQVPHWLQQAAKVKAMALVASHPVITEANIKLDAKMLDMQFAALINGHIRYTPSALLPE